MMLVRRTWKSRIAAGLITLAGFGLGGCKGKIIQEPADWPEAIPPRIPPTLETQPQEALGPVTTFNGIQPATVVDTDRQLRKMTLKEALAIAIEGGNTGSQGLNGQDSTALPAFTGRGTNGTDTVRAFVMDPAIASAEVERSLSKFDARWISSMVWQKQDQPTLTLQQSFSNGDTAALTSTLVKPLPTGGVAGITTSINYLNLSTPPTNTQFVALNTSYTPRVQFIFEQPLLQGFGVEANQLLGNHLGSILIPGLRASGGAGTEGILVTRVRNEQAKSNFDAQVNQLLLNVEIAYWNLFAAYYNLYAQEEGLKASYRYYRLLEDRKNLDLPTLLPQAKAQYWLFRQQVITARGQVLTADRNLRGILGMRSDDGTVLIPDDQPTLTKMPVDFNAAIQEAMQFRPELLTARYEVKAQQLNLLNQRNLRMPEVRAYGSYDIAGLGSGLSGTATTAGGQPANALQSFGNNQFNSYQIGLRADIPIGFRDANALVRQSQLSLWKSFEQLRDSERKAHEFMVESVRNLEQSWATVEVNRNRRVALEDQLSRIRERIYGEVWRGTDEQNALIIALRDFSNATADEFRAIANYNSALAQIEYAKGTIQRYNHVAVSEGPLPAFVQKKASDHFRARSAGLKLREHPAELPLTALDRYQPTPIDALPLPGGNTAPAPQALPTPLPGPAASPTAPPKPSQMPALEAKSVPPSIPLPGSVTPWDPRVATPITPEVEILNIRPGPPAATPTIRPAPDATGTPVPPAIGGGSPVSVVPPR
jgi:outer membrane protein TolC